jgi:hypothetical protein
MVVMLAEFSYNMAYFLFQYPEFEIFKERKCVLQHRLNMSITIMMMMMIIIIIALAAVLAVKAVYIHSCVDSTSRQQGIFCSTFHAKVVWVLFTV